MSATYLYINDSLSRTWRLSISDTFVINATEFTPSFTPLPLYVNDTTLSATSYVLSIIVAGSDIYLNNTPVSFSALYPHYQFLNSPSIDNIALGVSSGILFSETGIAPPFVGVAGIDEVGAALALSTDLIRSFLPLSPDTILLSLQSGVESISTIS